MVKSVSCRFLYAAAAVLALVGPARAEVLCKAKSGLLRLRATCKTRETPLPIAIADDGKTVLVTGANVKIVNGTGATDGSPNGLGNLILGYDLENRPDVGDGPDIKTGSHNLVIGDEHTYASTSGLVVGLDNAATGVGASVVGGLGNNASGDFAAISGGRYGHAAGIASSISGGLDNQALGDGSSVLGGELNVAGEARASVVGGRSNSAGGVLSVVIGGDGNTASGPFEIMP